MNTKWFASMIVVAMSFAACSPVIAQQAPNTEQLETLMSRWGDVLTNIRYERSSSDADFKLFTNFNRHYIDSARSAFFIQARAGKITNTTITSYLQTQKEKFKALYTTFLQVKKEYPSSVEEFRKPHNATLDTCFPSCTNVDFGTGDFTGWSAYYGVNSSTNNFNITSITGGLLGSVTQGALDPNTSNTYQVHITSKLNNDWFLQTYQSINMPQASPYGGNFAAMIGDSVNNGSGVAILSQKFFVSPSTTNFTYQYSVFLENPNHPYVQQPFFKVALLDQNGDTIPYCGDYVVVSDSNNPGFKGEYYSPRTDTIYWKDWTIVNVPLAHYVGQCVTIVFEVSDCELGAHCGYAYVAASCSPLAISAAAPISCGRNTTTLTGPTGASGYAWSGPSNGIIGSNTTQTITVDSGGTYTLVITPVTGAQCKDTLTVNVTRSSGLTLTMSSSPVLCNGTLTGGATATVSGGVAPYTYSWLPCGCTGATIGGHSAGTYTVFVTDSYGCNTSATVVITEPSPLVLTVSSSQSSVCAGQPVNVSASVSGGKAPYTYSWNNGNSTSSFTDNPLHSTNYNLTITDSNGCTVNGTVHISVNNQLSASVGQNIPVCAGESVTLKINPFGGTGNYHFKWMPGNDTTSAITITPMTTITYTVIVSDGCSLPDTLYEEVIVNPLPNVNFSGPTTGCAPVCLQFGNASSISSGSISQWHWDFGDSSHSTSQNPYHCYNNPGVYSVYLTATSDAGCTATLERINLITVYGTPVAAYTPNPQPTDIYNPVITFNNESSGKDSIISTWWKFGEEGDSNTSSEMNPIHRYKDTGTYHTSLVIVNTHGCVDSISHDVVIGPGFTIYFPNAFSPNADGKNEFFLAKGSYVKDFEMYIYDRWGMKLFHTTSLDEGWDGRISGNNTECQEDTYVYVATASDLKGNKHQFLGQVVLIK